MAANIKLKRSAVQSRVPTTSDLELGELGLNTYDGKVYMKKDDGTAAIVEVGGGGGSGALTDDSSDDSVYPSTATRDLKIGGTLPSAPNITLASDGAITAGTYNALTVGFGGGDLNTNTAVGDSALDSNTTGLYNTAIGRYTLFDNTIGGSNTATGHLALSNNTEGNNSTAMGRQSLQDNTTGAGNSGFGFRSLQKNTEGNQNTAIGLQSLQLNISGLSNTAAGSGALQNNTTSSSNSAVGRQSLFNSNAANNSGVGYRALYNNSTGTRNTAVGCQAGFYIEGDNNTILGGYLGTTADSTLSDTVIISAGNTERARIDSSGDLLFGGTLPSAPNITLASSGSATFAGTGYVAMPSGTTAQRVTAANGHQRYNSDLGAMEIYVQGQWQPIETDLDYGLITAASTTTIDYGALS